MNDETPRKPRPADYFRAMADSIERNPDQFAGALLIVPPDNEDIVEILFLASKAELDTFWGSVQARVKVELAKLENRQAGQRAGWATG